MNKIHPEITYTFIFGLMAYLLSDDLIIAAMMLCCSLGYYILYFAPRIKIIRHRDSLLLQLCQFVNNIIISLSVTNSLENAVAEVKGKNSVSDSELETINAPSAMESLESLQPYFDAIQYDIFLNLIRLYQETGTGILHICESYLPVLQSLEKTMNDLKSLFKRKTFEFAILWGFSFAILLFCRLGLSALYAQIHVLMVFKIAVSFLFIFALFSIHMHFRQRLNTPYAEMKNHG